MLFNYIIIINQALYIVLIDIEKCVGLAYRVEFTLYFFRKGREYIANQHVYANTYCWRGDKVFSSGEL